ncbi:MAG TPA: carbohydrate ABC transporter permease [Chloroflexi bacterium]|nr:carbohydrate ABC transporter permease [Chloroflexota bacterium]
MAKRSRITRVIGQFILYFLLTFGAMVAMIPLFWMVSTSLMTIGETINRQLLPNTPQFINYAEAWDQSRFERYFLNSIIITTITLIGLMISSVLAGYAFGRIKFPGRNIIFAILLSTMMIPESVTVLPNQLLVRGLIIPLPGVDQRVFDTCIADGGQWLSCQLSSFGMGVSWINSLTALTLPFMASAFSIFLLRQFFAQIPDELWDAARMDGAGHMRFLWQIVLPISKAPLMTVFLFGFIGSWNAFMWPLLVTTKDVKRPIMVGLWSFVTEAGPETHLLMAGAVIALIPILIIYFLTQKQFTQGIATTGLKG